MTIASALQDLVAKMNAGFADIKAAIASKQSLAEGNADLAGQLAEYKGKLETAEAQVVALGEKVSEVEAERDSARADADAAKAEVEKLKANAVTAEQKAAGIVAGLGVPAVSASGNDNPAGDAKNLGEQFSAITDPRARAEFITKHGGSSKLFAAIRAEARRK
jgi:septal ring factor EnvC (AmiA/AmiB activator)